MLGCSGAYAQAEIDPDHFDSPSTPLVSQPKTANRKTAVTRYDCAFSLPYCVWCNGKQLAPGKYSLSLCSEGSVGHATLHQNRHRIEIAGVVRIEAPEQRGDVVVVENNKNGRTLSVFRVRGFDFVFDPKQSADSAPDGRHAEKLPLTMLARSEIIDRVPSQAPLRP